MQPRYISVYTWTKKGASGDLNLWLSDSFTILGLWVLELSFFLLYFPIYLSIYLSTNTATPPRGDYFPSFCPEAPQSRESTVFYIYIVRAAVTLDYYSAG